MGKKTNKGGTYFFYGFLFLLMALSWKYFQAANSVMFDSDQAVWVLLAESPHFPDAWYFYGQNRLGSLLPLMAHLLVGLGLEALVAVSLMNLLFQGAAAALIFHLSKSAAAALSVACLFLFPPWTLYVLSFIGHPYTSQWLLWLGILWILKPSSQPISWQKSMWLAILSLLSLWVSDLSILFFPLLAYHLWFEQKMRNRQQWALLLSLGISGIVLLFLLKQQLPGPRGYFLKFTDWQGLLLNGKGLLSIFTYFWHMGTLVKVAMILSLGALIVFLAISKSHNSAQLSTRYGVLALVFTLSSHWVATNQGEARYFAFPLLLLLLGMVLRKSERPIALGIHGLWLAISLAMAWNTKTHLVSDYRATPERPSRSEMEQLASRIDGAVVADYWSMYLLKVFNPNLLVTQEHWPVRDPWNREIVFQQDRIWVVNLPIPDEIQLEGATYLAVDKPIELGNSKARLYQRE